MKITLILLAVMASVAIGGIVDDVKHRLAWESFKLNFKKTYGNVSMDNQRMQIFNANLKLIEAHALNGFEIGVNKFADISHDEFNDMYKGFVVSPEEQAATEAAYAKYLIDNPPRVKRAAPNNFDWRDLGAVTSVKDQANCQSCYAFATTGALESQIFIKMNKSVSLSPQNIVDCATSANGCNGGGNKIAYNYIKNNGGVNSFPSYPYKAAQSACKYNSSAVAGTTTGYIQSTQFDENALKNSVYLNGPHSIAIDSAHSSLQLYKSGIYYEPDCSSTKTDHSVILVGYGTNSTTNEDYWIVKNSWGTGWGMNGYFYLARNRNNHCGVATYATCPTV